jgi:CO/xanthine dehydrogenase Mo-binding subunit
MPYYHVPVNADILEHETIFVEEDDKIVNPLGIRGMGELGMVGVPAAIANAVFQVLLQEALAGYNRLVLLPAIQPRRNP